MKPLSYFQLLSILSSLVLLSSCSMLSTVVDDDVYVLSTPTLESGEELNDETSYQNYRYQKERQHQNVRYGFNTYTGMMIVMGSPYSYPGLFPYYGGYYSVFDHPYYNPYYNNYYAYMGYPSYYTYPGGFYNPNYPYGVGYGNYYSPYDFGNLNAPSTNSHNYNTHYSARNSVSGANISRRKANNNQFGGMTGMAKPTNSKTKNDYAHNGNTSITPRSIGTNVARTSRPVEKGVGLSRPGTRVTSVNYTRNAGSPAYQRSSNEVKSNVGRSGNNTNNDSRQTVSPSKTKTTTTTPTPGRRKN